MRSIITNITPSNNERLNIKIVFLVPAIILLAVSSVMQSQARPHNYQPRPVNPSSLVYNPDFGRRDSSCFNIPGLPDQYTCGTSN